MKTNVKMTKFVRRVMTIAAAMLMVFTVFAAAVPAQAVENTPAAGGTTTFNKYLVMPKDANVPNVTFTFTIAPGVAVAATGSSSAIYAGDDTNVTGAPTITAGASFDPSDTTYTQQQDGDQVTLSGNQKYAKESVTVDFSDVVFNAPGIYRYIITEAASNTSGITNDPVTTRTLDVYVQYKNDSEVDLEVFGYVLKNGEAVDKSNGFTNTYATNNLSLEKQVSGNQGDRNKYFEFTVRITAAVAGTKYNVDTSSGNTYLPANPTTLTVAEDGTVEGKFYLKDGEKVVIQGLTAATNFAITETSYATEGYTTKYKVDNGEEQSNNTASGTMGKADHTVVFTNHKEGTVPTGVLLEIAPYIALAVVVIAGFVVLFATRRRRER